MGSIQEERTAPPAKAYLTNAEARDYLGLSRSTLARLRSSGALKYSKVGSNVFYALVDIEDLLASRTSRAD
jgi:excisionase family DNA binding protein